MQGLSLDQEKMQTFKKQKTIDSFCRKVQSDKSFDLPLARFVKKHKNTSVLFSKFGQTENFSTNNLELHFIKSDKKPDFRSLDGFLRFEKRMPIFYALKNRFDIYGEVKKRYPSFKEYFQESFRNPFEELSMVKMWNVSIVGALIFGMFIMTFIYRYLGQNVVAVEGLSSLAKTAEMMEMEKGMVLGSESEREKAEADHVLKIENEYEDEKKIQENIEKMVEGYPIEKMIPQIVKQDATVAAFLVSIAKKESNWGKRVPTLDGQDCYNYWGYRGIRPRMGTGGHTCFDSREDAVKTVGKRLQNIIEKENIKTPEEMVRVWKCGYDCSWDNPSAVRKWVSDVKGYFDAVRKGH
jgi:hypothetical protein